ncbi:MAG: hypothetical protein AAGD32_17180 [Planctomycetota bacterium]
MDTACNIDSKGRLFRGVLGSVTLIIAGILGILWAWPTGSILAWIVVVIAVGFGAMGLYQAKRGWCAARAMGMKTPI